EAGVAELAVAADAAVLERDPPARGVHGREPVPLGIDASERQLALEDARVNRAVRGHVELPAPAVVPGEPTFGHLEPRAPDARGRPRAARALDGAGGAASAGGPDLVDADRVLGDAERAQERERRVAA